MPETKCPHCGGTITRPTEDALVAALEEIKEWCSDAQPATEGARLCAWHAKRISRDALAKHRGQG